MCAMTTSSPRSMEMYPMSAGVFEDDALLLCLAEPSRLAGAGISPRPDRDELADGARDDDGLIDFVGWDF